MSTQYTLRGIAVDYLEDDEVGIRSSTLRISVPNAVTSFSYQILPVGDDDIPNVAFDLGGSEQVLLDGENPSFVEDDQFGFVSWRDGGVTKTAYFMAFHYETGGNTGTDHYFQVGGDAFPRLTTLAEWEAFDASITNAGAVSSGPFAPNQPILFSEVLDADVSRDGYIAGTTGDDMLDIGVADNPRFLATVGDDEYDFAGVEDWSELSYGLIANGVNININGIQGVGVVNKKASGADTLFNVAEALVDDRGFNLTGTDYDDLFNIKTKDGQWASVLGGEGDDTFTLTVADGSTIRIKYHYGPNGDPINGVNVNLATGTASNDGFGFTDTFNITGDGRIEIEATDFDDTIVGSDRNERFILRQGNDTLDGGGGWDMLRYDRSDVSGVTVNFGTGVATGMWDGESFTHSFSNIEAVRGSRLGNDTFIGSDADEYFDAREGDDTINAGGGDDEIVYGPGSDTIDGGSGSDFLSLWRATEGVQVHLENGWIRSAGEEDSIASIEGISGSDFADVFVGSAADEWFRGQNGDDRILGAGGDDWINGGAGADYMNGGPGSDRFFVDNVGDQVVESNRWAGHDTVESSVDFRMGRKHIEDLELTGEAILGAGNGLMNTITGNDQNNILDGGKNNDTLIGGLGNDTYLIRAPGDTAVEQAGEGNDAVKAYRSYALEAHVEKLYMQNVFTKDGNPANLNGIGNGLDNTIIGTPYANTIVGREGNDTLKGQGGADTFVFDRALDEATNVDRLIDFGNGDDVFKLKASVFTGLSAGALAADAFVLGTAAADANDRIIYDQTTGQLWHDGDGVGGADATLFATLANKATLEADDFAIV